MFIGSFNSDVIGKSDNILNGKNKILFFQGSIGSGRTTIINHLAVKYKDKKILVIESNEISDKIFILLANDKNKSIESIKNNLFNYEIILFDNLEYFINKPKFCELLFNLFKELNAANKKIIISSSNTVDFKKINQEFYSYITNDLISEINKPSLNELKTISVFFVKSLNNKINFTDEALDFLATRNGNGNLRKLKSDISSILFYTNEGNGTITVNDVKKYIEMPIKGKNNTLIVDPNKIISSICSYFKIDENEVKSPQRNKYIVNIRNICMYGLNKKYHLTLKNIGSHFSNKSHSNVKRSVDLVQNRAEKNDQFAKEIELLFKNL
jgi:chromosomal replication initiator protein